MVTKTTKNKVKKKATKKKVAKKKTIKKEIKEIGTGLPEEKKVKRMPKNTTGRTGRPSGYKPEYCDTVIEVMRQGYSKEAVAGHLEISKDTLYQWEKAHADFSDALKRGVELSRIFWERTALETITHRKDTTQLNSTSWIFNMKNRFGWKDKTEISADEATKKSFGFSLDQKPEEIN